MNVSEWLKKVTNKLGSAGIETARLDCLIILEDTLQKDRAWLLAHPEYHIDQQHLRQLNELVARRTKREPLAYIRGKVEFYGLELTVTPDTLIPRPETEELVSQAIHLAPQNANLLEVGTGSGAITIALALERPDLKLTATDISASALEVARQNVTKYTINDIEFKQTDLVHDINDSFDLIITNLPYVPKTRQLEAELVFEPAQALFGGEDGLDHYRRLFKQLDGRSRPVWLVLEAEPGQRQLLEQIGRRHHFRLIEQTSFCYIFKPKASNSLA